MTSTSSSPEPHNPGRLSGNHTSSTPLTSSYFRSFPSSTQSSSSSPPSASSSLSSFSWVSVLSYLDFEVDSGYGEEDESDYDGDEGKNNGHEKNDDEEKFAVVTLPRWLWNADCHRIQDLSPDIRVVGLEIHLHIEQLEEKLHAGGYRFVSIGLDPIERVVQEISEQLNEVDVIVHHTATPWPPLLSELMREVKSLVTHSGFIPSGDFENHLRTPEDSHFRGQRWKFTRRAIVMKRRDHWSGR